MINFNNQQLLTVEKDGIRYVAVKPICENLGLDWSSQKKRIERDDVLNSTMVIMTTVAEDQFLPDLKDGVSLRAVMKIRLFLS